MTEILQLERHVVQRVTAWITANNRNPFQRRGVYSSAAFKSGSIRMMMHVPRQEIKSNIIKSKKVKGEIDTHLNTEM